MTANDPMHLGHMAAEAELVKAFLRTRHPVELSDAEIADYKTRITARLREKDAVLVAHYYTSPLVQALAEETAAASPIRCRWRASAMIIPPPRSSWPGCVSWARPRRSSRRKSVC